MAHTPTPFPPNFRRPSGHRTRGRSRREQAPPRRGGQRRPRRRGGREISERPGSSPDSSPAAHSLGLYLGVASVHRPPGTTGDVCQSLDRTSEFSPKSQEAFCLALLRLRPGGPNVFGFGCGRGPRRLPRGLISPGAKGGSFSNWCNITVPQSLKV